MDVLPTKVRVCELSESSRRNTPKGRRPLAVAGLGLVSVTLLGICLWTLRGPIGNPETVGGGDASAPSAGISASRAGVDGSESVEPQPANRLARETSPYLLQHAHNPVNWYPWGPEAFERAKREGKLIFLSVGYSTCFWCHVMERESFEDDEVARILNEHYIAIKVDREERPDIDEQYMLASQLLTGRGGWPNSVWLTPDGKPWMAGSYFPRNRFKDLLLKFANLWNARPQDIEEQAEELTVAIRRSGVIPTGAVAEHPLNQQLIDDAVSELKRSFDAEHGGFNTAPKFPPHDHLLLLAHEYRRSRDQTLRKILTTTLDAMARGGIHDQLGGGFHRYSTDQQWLLPHFEKMLYDNAQLLRTYVDGYLLTGDETYREVVQDIVSWVSREMTDPGGAFYSAIDAESEQEEGKFYVWTYYEVIQALGQEQGSFFAAAYGVEQGGNFVEQATGERPGTNVLYLSQPLEQVARDRGIDLVVLKSDLREIREKLLTLRAQRARPHQDDKILSGWNGLMIGSLAYAGRQLQEPSYTNAAARAAQFVLSKMVKDGRLLRTYRAGSARLPAYLDDYAFFAAGLLDLYEATGDRQWLDHAKQLADTMVDGFQDEKNGAFFFTTSEHEELLVRSKNIFGGGNIPSGNGVAAELLLRLARISGQPGYREQAEQTLEAISDLMWRQSTSTDSLLLATAISLQQDERRPAEISATTQPIQTAGRGTSDVDSRHQEGPITAQAFASRQSVTPGQTFHVAVVLDIQSGWHLYGPNPDVMFVNPTTVTLRPHPALRAGDVVVPKGQRAQDPVLGQTLKTYEGRITFLLPVTLTDDTAFGPVTLEIELHAQACDDHRCLSPTTTKLQLPVVVRGDISGSHRLHGEIFRPLGIDDE